MTLFLLLSFAFCKLTIGECLRRKPFYRKKYFFTLFAKELDANVLVGVEKPDFVHASNLCVYCSLKLGIL